MKKQLTYFLSIIAPVAGLGGALLLAYRLFDYIVQDNHWATLKATDPNIFLRMIGIFACLLIMKLSYRVRISVRDDLEFDEFGNKKGNDYKHLSASEKKIIDRQNLADQERLISAAEFKKVTHPGSLDPHADLNKMIGLQNVKEEIEKMEAKMQYDSKYAKKQKDHTNDVGYHMCFLGSPGTGKTTVARIMTGFLYKYKYVKRNQCVEIDGAFLKGATPDDTLKKTKMILNRSKGGVLFIDEAYSLLNGVNGGEIIAQLVKYMEDHRGEFILILAGYQNEMHELIDSNPGLYSRISTYMWFKDYSIEELKQILTLDANNAGYVISDGAYERFEKRISIEKRGKNFGNARSVNNIWQSILDKHAYNVMTKKIDSKNTYMIQPEDVDLTTDAQKIFNT